MKVKKYIKYIPYCLFIVMAISYIITHLNDVSDGNFVNSKIIILLFGIIAIAVITTISILFFFRTKKIEKQFVIIAVLWGIIFSFVIPPMQAPDENLHAYRAYDLAKGNVFYLSNEDSMMLPAGIKEYEEKIRFEEQRFNWWVQLDIKDYLKSIDTGLQKDDLIKYDAGATNAYVSMAYIPQAIGIFIGDVLNLPPYFVLNIGRLFNLLTWTTICYFALKLIPIKKSLLMLLMLIPVGLQQASSLSPDALLNSCSFLMISFILFLKFKKDRIELVDYLLLIALTIIVGAIKLPYIFISLLLFIIPKNKFKFKSFGKIILIFGIVFINLLVMVGWMKLSAPKTSNNIQITQQNNNGLEEVQSQEENNTDVVKSAGYVETVTTILKSPIDFVGKCIDTIKMNWDLYKMSFVAYFGWMDTKSPMSFVNLWLIVLFLFMVIPEDTKYSFGKFERLFLLLIPIFMYLGLCAVIVKWNGAEFNSLVSFEGLQGRYFYPFIMSLFLVFHNSKTKYRLNNNNLVMHNYRNLFITLSLAISTALMLARFYIGYIRG